MKDLYLEFEQLVFFADVLDQAYETLYLLLRQLTCQLDQPLRKTRNFLKESIEEIEKAEFISDQYLRKSATQVFKNHRDSIVKGTTLRDARILVQQTDALLQQLGEHTDKDLKRIVEEKLQDYDMYLRCVYKIPPAFVDDEKNYWPAILRTSTYMPGYEVDSRNAGADKYIADFIKVLEKLIDSKLIVNEELLLSIKQLVTLYRLRLSYINLTRLLTLRVDDDYLKHCVDNAEIFGKLSLFNDSSKSSIVVTFNQAQDFVRQARLYQLPKSTLTECLGDFSNILTWMETQNDASEKLKKFNSTKEDQKNLEEIFVKLKTLKKIPPLSRKLKLSSEFLSQILIVIKDSYEKYVDFFRRKRPNGEKDLTTKKMTYVNNALLLDEPIREVLNFAKKQVGTSTEVERWLEKTPNEFRESEKNLWEAVVYHGEFDLQIELAEKAKEKKEAKELKEEKTLGTTQEVSPSLVRGWLNILFESISPSLQNRSEEDEQKEKKEEKDEKEEKDKWIGFTRGVDPNPSYTWINFLFDTMLPLVIEKNKNLLGTGLDKEQQFTTKDDLKRLKLLNYLRDLYDLRKIINQLLFLTRTVHTMKRGSRGFYIRIKSFIKELHELSNCSSQGYTDSDYPNIYECAHQLSEHLKLILIMNFPMGVNPICFDEESKQLDAFFSGEQLDAESVRALSQSNSTLKRIELFTPRRQEEINYKVEFLDTESDDQIIKKFVDQKEGSDDFFLLVVRMKSDWLLFRKVGDEIVGERIAEIARRNKLLKQSYEEILIHRARVKDLSVEEEDTIESRVVEYIKSIVANSDRPFTKNKLISLARVSAGLSSSAGTPSPRLRRGSVATAEDARRESLGTPGDSSPLTSPKFVGRRPSIRKFDSQSPPSSPEPTSGVVRKDSNRGLVSVSTPRVAPHERTRSRSKSITGGDAQHSSAAAEEGVAHESPRKEKEDPKRDIEKSPSKEEKTKSTSKSSAKKEEGTSIETSTHSEKSSPSKTKKDAKDKDKNKDKDKDKKHKDKEKHPQTDFFANKEKDKKSLSRRETESDLEKSERGEKKKGFMGQMKSIFQGSPKPERKEGSHDRDDIPEIKEGSTPEIGIHLTTEAGESKSLSDASSRRGSISKLDPTPKASTVPSPAPSPRKPKKSSESGSSSELTSSGSGLRPSQ